MDRVAQLLSGAAPQQLGDVFGRNQPYVRPGAQSFATQLQPADELAFRQWVSDNQVPFDPNAAGPTDYDMRGFWRALQQQNPRAVTAVNSNDGQLHYPDFWKTPLHATFSGESQWATPVAPMWNDRDQLISPGGRILFDERQR